MKIIIIYNLIVFVIYGIDKKKAIKGKRRISEHFLITLSLFLGSFGAICAMLFFRHKTKSNSFKLKIFITTILNILFIIYILFNKI